MELKANWVEEMDDEINGRILERMKELKEIKRLKCELEKLEHKPLEMGNFKFSVEKVMSFADYDTYFVSLKNASVEIKDKAFLYNHMFCEKFTIPHFIVDEKKEDKYILKSIVHSMSKIIGDFAKLACGKNKGRYEIKIDVKLKE